VQQSALAKETRMTEPLSSARLTECLADARLRTLELVHGLDAAQLMGPRLDIVNPLLWEIGHVSWFHEYFALRRLDGGSPRLPNADALYNSSTVPHDVRWELPLPSLQGTLDYLAWVQDTMVRRLDRSRASEEETSLYLTTIYHEDMHDEAFTYSRQTLGYPAPVFAAAQGMPQRRSEPGLCRATSPFPVAFCSLVRRRRRRLCSTTRNGPILWRCRRSASRVRR
jgi:iron(II)-dependent oxidoreductase